MNITWDDVDRIDTPRWVTVEGKRFEVKQLHIDAWKDDPNGSWSLTQARPVSGQPKWALGVFYPSTDE